MLVASGVVKCSVIGVQVSYEVDGYVSVIEEGVYVCIGDPGVGSGVCGGE